MIFKVWFSSKIQFVLMIFPKVLPPEHWCGQRPLSTFFQLPGQRDSPYGWKRWPLIPVQPPLSPQMISNKQIYQINPYKSQHCNSTKEYRVQRAVFSRNTEKYVKYLATGKESFGSTVWGGAGHCSSQFGHWLRSGEGSDRCQSN